MSQQETLKKTDEKQLVIKSDLWKPDYIHLFRIYREEGLTYEQIAEKLGICRNTIYRWKKSIPELALVIKQAEKVRDFSLVEGARNALKKLVYGYEYQEIQKTVEEIPTFKDGEVIFAKKKKQTITTKHKAPDITAIKTALYNKDSKNYRPEMNKSDIQEDIEIIVELEDD